MAARKPLATTTTLLCVFWAGLLAFNVDARLLLQDGTTRCRFENSQITSVSANCRTFASGSHVCPAACTLVTSSFCHLILK